MRPPVISSHSSNGKLSIVIRTQADAYVDVDVSIKSSLYAFTVGTPAEDDTFGSSSAAWRNRKVTQAAPLGLEFAWSTSSDAKTPYAIVARVRDQDVFSTHWGHLGVSSERILDGLDEGSKEKLTRWWLDKMPEVDPKLFVELLEKKLPPPPRGERPPREER